jgi:hypothetical protein
VLTVTVFKIKERWFFAASAQRKSSFTDFHFVTQDSGISLTALAEKTTVTSSNTLQSDTTRQDIKK